MEFTGLIVQIVALAGSFFAAIILTPVFRLVALRIGLVDNPDARRKLHKEPVALCGGPVILVSTLLVAAIAALCVPIIWEAVETRLQPLAGLLFGCFGIVTLGILDDRFGLRGRQKLIGQFVIAAVLAFSGYRITLVGFLGYTIDLGVFAIPVSIGWLLLTINSINLIDGADGLCCSVGWIASAGFAAMATLLGHWLEGTFAAAVAGALLGFLVYNFPPAKVFLGDSGSMLVGLVLGALAIRTSLKGPTAVSMLGAVAVLALPFFDSSMAIIRRKLTGRSIFSTDRGHLHHNLISKGFAHSKLVLFISVCSGILAAGAFFSAAFNNELLAILSVLVVLGCLVVNRLFGHAELRLLASRVAHFSTSLVPSFTKNHSEIRGQHYRLQGERSWETIWDSLVEFADKHNLSKVCLDLNVPWLHEGYHACWNRDKTPEESNRWKMALPVYANEQALGRIEFVGPVTAAASITLLESLTILVDSLQQEVTRLVHDHQDTLLEESADSVDQELIAAI